MQCAVFLLLRRSFALLSLLLFAAQPASAQGPGHWVLSIENNGATDYYSSSAGDFNVPWYTHMTQGADPGFPFTAGDTITVSSMGTGKLTAHWVDAQGNPASNPPAKVFVHAWPWASWRINTDFDRPVDVISHSASDGNGDPENAPSYFGWVDNGDSQIPIYSDNLGTTLTAPIMLDGSSGTAKKEYTMSAQVNFTSNGPLGVVGVNCQLEGRVLNFSGIITSSIDPTYHRGTGANGPMRVANTAGGSGNINADSRIPSDTPFSNGATDITFNASVSGDWGDRSYYHWYSQVKDFASSGYFNPQPLTNTYVNSDGKNENIDLHLMDGPTGYDMHIDYMIKFHDAYEDWTQKAKVRHPLSFVSGGQNPDWNYVFYVHNPTSKEQEQDLSQEFSLKLTMTGEIGGSGSVGPEGAKAFEINEKLTIGTEVAAKATATQKYMIPAYTDATCYAAISCEDRSGTTSLWDTSGYVFDTIWHGKYVSPALSLAIDPKPIRKPKPVLEGVTDR